MSREDEPRPPPVEWVDLDAQNGPVEVLDTGRPPRRHRSLWVSLGIAALAALGVVIGVRAGDGGSPSAAPASARASQSASTSSPSVRPTSAVPWTTPPPQVTVTDFGHPLLGVSAPGQLFARGPGEVVRVDLAHGLIVRTKVPRLASDGSVSFVPTAGAVLIRPTDVVPGYLVPDGKPPRRLTGRLAEGGRVFPGPKPDEVWVQVGTNEDGSGSLTLVGLNGAPAGASIAIPAGSWPLRSDGAGYLLFSGVGGVYDARPDGLHRITTGTLLAAGPTRWLVTECDAGYHCASVVIDRASGARRTLRPGVSDPNGSVGIISPDGSTAAMLRGNSPNVTVHLLDLVTGADRVLPHVVPTDRSFNGGVLAWSPDSRWLFVAGADGHIWAAPKRATGLVRDLGVSLPQLTQLAVR